MFRLRVLIGLALIGCPLRAQQVLQPFGEVAAPGIANALTAVPTRCDAHGDVYLRIASAPDVSHQLLARIGRDGSMATFNAEKVTDTPLRDWFFQDFAITSDAVWLLGTMPSKANSTLNYLLQFNLQGDYKRSLQLESDFDMEQLAVFDTGDFLVSGIERIGRDTLKAVTAMFDRQGRFLKRILTAAQSKQADKEEPPSTSDPTAVSANITLGTSESYGGEIYVLRASAPPVVLVISSGGTVARQFVLEPPSPDARPGEMRVAQGQIAVEFLKPKSDGKPLKSGEPVFYDFSQAEYVVYNAFTGDKVAGYTRALSLSGSFVCFDGRGGFDFLAQTESGTRKIIRAGAR